VKTLRLSCLLLAASALPSPEAAGAGVEPAPALSQSQWNGYTRVDFTVAGRPALLVFPAQAAPGRPWIWRTEFFGHEPQADLALLAQGWHVTYLDARNLYGAPRAIAWFGQFYAHVVVRFGLAQRVVLEGFSRGGLYAINFALAHPTRVAALYLDAPVLDIRSWPGRNRQAKEWPECLAAYDLSEAALEKFRGPLDRLATLAKAGVPILSVCGDADQVVPYAENTAILEKRYREAGGTIEVILKPGGDHHPHSLKDPAPIVAFLAKHAKF
jgi:pimeloyl-ACP methyl ester carboxylesterase